MWLCIDNTGDKLASNAKLIQSGDFDKYTRKLEIELHDIRIDSDGFVAVLREAGIGQQWWPQIKMLRIISCMMQSDYVQGNANAEPAAREVADAISKTLPSITEIDYIQTVMDEEMDMDLEYPCLSVIELANRYSSQLRKANLGLCADCFSMELLRDLSVPQQLTHLDIHMNTRERQMLPTIFAPMLQYLRIDLASPDITWNWFNSGNEDEVCFSQLLALEITFNRDDLPGLTYHNGNLRNIGAATFRSDYHDAAKQVHFPVLEKLRVLRIPYVDNSFYRLFEDSPLKDITLDQPIGVQGRIPAKILANLMRMDVAVYYGHLVLQFDDNGHGPPIVDETSYKQALARLMTSPSTAFSARVYLSTEEEVALPDTLAWTSIRRLDLDFEIDMKSALVVIAQMPELQHLVFRMSPLYLNRASAEDASQSKRHGEQERAANSSVECLVLNINPSDELEERSLRYLLSSILPSTPSLLKLAVHEVLVEAAKRIVSDPANSLEPMARQLEITPYKR
ncbi:hypothetical protein GGI12_002131 [Dipsacomyces acuminosporus]|nr:hypothetical protein GGI12_002131 [Dipsacomyces acuminosporus]